MILVSIQKRKIDKLTASLGCDESRCQEEVGSASVIEIGGGKSASQDERKNGLFYRGHRARESTPSRRKFFVCRNLIQASVAEYRTLR